MVSGVSFVKKTLCPCSCVPGNVGLAVTLTIYKLLNFGSTRDAVVVAKTSFSPVIVAPTLGVPFPLSRLFPYVGSPVLRSRRPRAVEQESREPARRAPRHCCLRQSRNCQISPLLSAPRRKRSSLDCPKNLNPKRGLRGVINYKVVSQVPSSSPPSPLGINVGGKDQWPYQAAAFLRGSAVGSITIMGISALLPLRQASEGPPGAGSPYPNPPVMNSNAALPQPPSPPCV